MLPEGIYAHQIVTDKLFSSYPVHNDFLEYIYNYGFLFYILITWIFWKIISLFKSKVLGLILIVIISSFALHNELFSVYLWIPILMMVWNERNIPSKHKVAIDEIKDKKTPVFTF